VDADILHDTADRSPGGVLNNVEAQPPPASAAVKPEPAIEISVNDSPLVGVSVIFGMTANVPVPTPPPAPSTCMVQVPPCAVVLTMKEAESAPAVILQVGEGAPAKRFDPACAVIEHGPLSAVGKVPMTLTGPVPVGPENGETVNVTGMPFVKVAKASSSIGPPPFPVTSIWYTPLAAAGATVNEPATVPSV